MIQNFRFRQKNPADDLAPPAFRISNMDVPLILFSSKFNMFIKNYFLLLEITSFVKKFRKKWFYRFSKNHVIFYIKTPEKNQLFIFILVKKNQFFWNFQHTFWLIRFWRMIFFFLFHVKRMKSVMLVCVPFCHFWYLVELSNLLLPKILILDVMSWI